MTRIALLMALAIGIAPHELFAAIGCTLTNPAQDLKYLYPEMTTYKEELNEFTRVPNGRDLFTALRERLGSEQPQEQTQRCEKVSTVTTYGLNKTLGERGRKLHCLPPKGDFYFVSGIG